MTKRGMAALAVAGALIWLGGAAMAKPMKSRRHPPKHGPDMASTSDKRFMMMVAEDNIAEVQMGKLATRKASSTSVKNVAKMIVADHSKANHDLMQLAGTKGSVLPTSVNARHRALIARLSRASGPSFDRMYVGDQLRAHNKAVEAFKREMEQGKDSEVRAFAAKTLPAIQDHTKMLGETKMARSGSKKHSP